MKPLGDTFVNLVRMVIAPVIFLTIVGGMAHSSDLRRIGRVGLKAFIYFEVVTTFALAIGLVVMHLVRPGDGIDAARLAAAADAGRVDLHDLGRRARRLLASTTASPEDST